MKKERRDYCILSVAWSFKTLTCVRRDAGDISFKTQLRRCDLNNEMNHPTDSFLTAEENDPSWRTS